MMTADEYRRVMLKNNILVILFLFVCIAGVIGAVLYYNKLKETNNKLKVAEAEIQLKNDSLREANEFLEVLKDSFAIQKERYAKILVSNNPTAIRAAAQTIERSRDSARAYAVAGYNKLKAKDFEGARIAFDKSEKFYNGYRDSYEVYYLLTRNKSKLNDPKVQQQVMNQVFTKFNSQGIIKRADLQ